MVKATFYNDDEFEALIKPLTAASKGRLVDRPRLSNDLKGILTATGLLTETDAEIVFSKAVAQRAFRDVYERLPEHERELELAKGLPASRAANVKARWYRAIAAAPDDALLAVLLEAIQRHAVIETEMRAAAQRRRWKLAIHTDDAEWRNDTQVLRQAAEHLAIFHRSQVQVGSPPRQSQQVLLNRLAEIYLRHTGSDSGPEDVPHAIKSYFIAFAYAALRPFIKGVTPARLSSAWARLKTH